MGRSEQVSSAENVLRLLVALSERDRIRVAEAAELLAVTPPTAHRLLATLKQHQFAEQDRQRAYVPGPRLTQMRRSGGPMPDIVSTAHPFLADLAATTGETAHLVALEGNGVRFIDGVDGSIPPRVRRRVGLLLPAHTVSGGKVLLAHLTDAQLAALYPLGKVNRRDGSTMDLAALRRELTVVRRQGFALNLGETEREVYGVGVPVVLPSRRAAGAVVIGSPAVRSSRTALTEHLPALRSCAASIADALANALTHALS